MNTPLIHPAELHMAGQLIAVSLLLWDRGKVDEARTGLNEVVAVLEQLRDRVLTTMEVQR